MYILVAERILVYTDPPAVSGQTQSLRFVNLTKQEKICFEPIFLVYFKLFNLGGNSRNRVCLCT